MHLNLLLHGLTGNPRDLDEAVRIFSQRHPEVHTLVATSYADSLSLDGIDITAQRVLQELDTAILTLNGAERQVRSLSITGYSMGGLVARYLVGLLYVRGFFETVQPMNFTTFTTPHIGVLPPPYGSAFWFPIGAVFLGRSGAQLHLTDNYATTGQPLLRALAHPDSVFCRGLALFHHITIYSNAINDVTVRYVSGAIEEYDPYRALKNPDTEIVPDYIADYAPVLDSFEVQKPPKHWIRKPRTCDGPVVPWVFPWNLIIYLILPLYIAGCLLFLAIYCPIALSASARRVKKLIPIYPLPPGPLLTPEAHSDALEMSPAQLGIVRALNSVIALRSKKYTVFRPGVRNSHGMMISLQKGWAEHRVGRGVLRHWSDHFVLVLP